MSENKPRSLHTFPECRFAYIISSLDYSRGCFAVRKFDLVSYSLLRTEDTVPIIVHTVHSAVCWLQKVFFVCFHHTTNNFTIQHHHDLDIL